MPNKSESSTSLKLSSIDDPLLEGIKSVEWIQKADSYNGFTIVFMVLVVIAVFFLSY